MGQKLRKSLIGGDEICVFIHQIKNCCVFFFIACVYRFNRDLTKPQHISELVFVMLEIIVCAKVLVFLVNFNFFFLLSFFLFYLFHLCLNFLLQGFRHFFDNF